jgi:hypothetical protein
MRGSMTQGYAAETAGGGRKSRAGRAKLRRILALSSAARRRVRDGAGRWTKPRNTADASSVSVCVVDGVAWREADARLVRAPMARAAVACGTCEGMGPVVVAAKIPKNSRMERKIQ